MNYQTKATKVQAMRLEQDLNLPYESWVKKGDWLVIDSGNIIYFKDEEFKELYELVLSQPTYTKLDEILRIGMPRSVRLLSDQGSYRDTSGYKIFD